MSKQLDDIFNSKEKSLWKSLFVPTLEDIEKSNPEMPILEGYYLCYEQFCLCKWRTELKKKDFVLIPQEEYESIPDTFGPDLTILPALRFVSTSKRLVNKDSPRKLNRYAKFIQIYVKEHQQTGESKKQIFVDAANKWKSLSEEEKAKYNE